VGCFSVNKAVPGYLGAYRLLNAVQTGPTSQIWQAYHDGQQRFFAIKTLLEKYRRKRTYVSYLRWEYRVGSRLDCPRVIRICEFAYDRGVPYLAMEWFPGGTMKTRLRPGADATAALLPKIAVQAAEAVAYVNSQGWVHRDIKPESYMAPEQIRGKALDQRADLYSLACTLYELVSGRPPFAAPSVKQLLSKHLNSPPPPLEAANRRVTPEFAQLIRWAMSKNPADRPRSTQEFFERIRQTPIFWRTLE